MADDAHGPRASTASPSGTVSPPRVSKPGAPRLGDHRPYLGSYFAPADRWRDAGGWRDPLAAYRAVTDRPDLPRPDADAPHGHPAGSAPAGSADTLPTWYAPAPANPHIDVDHVPSQDDHEEDTTRAWPWVLLGGVAAVALGVGGYHFVAANGIPTPVDAGAPSLPRVTTPTPAPHDVPGGATDAPDDPAGDAPADTTTDVPGPDPSAGIPPMPTYPGIPAPVPIPPNAFPGYPGLPGAITGTGMDVTIVDTAVGEAFTSADGSTITLDAVERDFRCDATQPAGGELVALEFTVTSPASATAPGFTPVPGFTLSSPHGALPASAGVGCVADSSRLLPSSVAPGATVSGLVIVPAPVAAEFTLEYAPLQDLVDGTEMVLPRWTID